MRNAVLLMILMFAGLSAGCSDAVGIGGGRSVNGSWIATVDREDIYLTLTEDRGQIWGSGSWGYDPVTVNGNRAGSEISLIIDFAAYNPINFQGSIRDNQLEGRLSGSGYRGDGIVFWRD